jgi:RHS repeat-associated protein
LLAVNSGTATYLPAFDGGGNVLAYIDATTGTSAAEFEYGPFGEPLRVTGAAAVNLSFRFSSKYTDAETGLVYYGYRWYQPSTGRFLSKDPIEEQGGVNLYGFVENDPVNGYDLLGKIANNMRDLGIRPEELIFDKKGRARTAKAGGTTGSITYSGGGIRENNGIFEIEVRDMAVTGSYWYADEDAKKHELVHVNLWLDAGSKFEAQVKEYKGPCRERVKCYMGLVKETAEAFEARARWGHAIWDCQEYGKCGDVGNRKRDWEQKRDKLNEKIRQCAQKNQ